MMDLVTGWYYLSCREGREGREGDTGRDTSIVFLSVWRKCCSYHDNICNNNTHITHNNIFKAVNASMCDW